MLMLHIYSIAKRSTYLLYSFSVFGLNTKGREASTAPRPNLSIIPERPTPPALVLASLSLVRRPFRIWRS